MQNRNQNINQNSVPLPLEKTDAFKPGDGKAVRDTQTNLVWLNFGITSAQSFNDVCNALTTTYQGWRLPTEQEVKDLWGRLTSNLSSDNPYEVFRVWGANKSPVNRAPYTSFGYFLDSQGFLASASIIEQGSQQNPNRDPFYVDGVVKSNIATDKEFNHNVQPDSPVFNMSGTQEISTLLVKA